jgi:cell pole-organizing protein PopZ
MSKLNTAGGEPSMDEILAQIRKIIADDNAPRGERRLEPPPMRVQVTSQRRSPTEDASDVAAPRPVSGTPTHHSIGAYMPTQAPQALPVATEVDDLSDLIETAEPTADGLASELAEPAVEPQPDRGIDVAFVTGEAEAIAPGGVASTDPVSVPSADEAPAGTVSEVEEPSGQNLSEAGEAVEGTGAPVAVARTIDEAMETALGALAAGLAAVSVTPAQAVSAASGTETSSRDASGDVTSDGAPTTTIGTDEAPTAVPDEPVGGPAVESMSDASPPAPIASIEAPAESATADAEPVAEAAAEDAPFAPGGTLDDSMAELLRPMLRQWLDDNMPRIVERALRVEMAKVQGKPRV